jgi:hypothetical protein
VHNATRHRSRQRFMQKYFDAPLNAGVEGEGLGD